MGGEGPPVESCGGLLVESFGRCLKAKTMYIAPFLQGDFFKKMLCFG